MTMPTSPGINTPHAVIDFSSIHNHRAAAIVNNRPPSAIKAVISIEAGTSRSCQPQVN
jgi:hypothetical protein